MGKFTRMHVYLTGLGVALVVGLGLFLALVNPASGRLKDRTAELDRLSTQADGLRSAPNDLKKAEVQKKDFERDFQRMLGAKTPPDVRLDFVRSRPLDLLGRYWTLPFRVIPMCEQYARRNPNRVRVLTQFGLGALTTNPAQIQRDILAWNVGRMTARGTFKNVMAWVRRWNKFKLLAAVDNLQVRKSGAVEIEATCDLIVYIFPVNEQTQPPAKAAGRA